MITDIKTPDGQTFPINKFQDGDSLSVSGIFLTGSLSNGTRTISATLTLPALVDSGVTPKLTELKCNIRGISGAGYYYGRADGEYSYVSGGNDYTALVSTFRLVGWNYINIAIYVSTGWKTGSGGSITPVNNTPIVIEVNSLKISFN